MFEILFPASAHMCMQADTGSSHEKQRCMAAFTNFGDKREYIQFLEQELEHTKYVGVLL